MYERGDVVLIPFPFTDLSSVKTRPAVVISVSDFEKQTGDFTIAMITSMAYKSSYDYALIDWQSANLLFPSWVRVKLVTLDPGLVRHKAGRLTDRDLKKIEEKIRLALGL